MSVVTGPGAAGQRGPGAPRVVVSVGTDHHPFDRLIGWVNDWLGQHPEQAGTFFVQWGAASVRPACAGSRFLTTQQLNALLDGAGVVVCHGGPGSIADAWARGQVPIVVPRLRRLGEVVDDHQVEFCVKLAKLGRVRLARTPEALAGFLDEAAGEYQVPCISGPDADVGATVARFAALVDELVGRPRRRLLLPHRAGRTRRGPGTHTGTAAAVSGRAAGLVPDEPTIWRANRSPAHFGLAGEPEEEQE